MLAPRTASDAREHPIAEDTQLDPVCGMEVGPEDAALVRKVSDLGAELSIAGPAEFGRIIEADRARYGRIVADGNLAKPN